MKFKLRFVIHSKKRLTFNVTAADRDELEGKLRLLRCCSKM